MLYAEYCNTCFRKAKKKSQTQNRLKTGSLRLLPDVYVVGILHWPPECPCYLFIFSIIVNLFMFYTIATITLI
jgi:hypothetical protein